MRNISKKLLILKLVAVNILIGLLILTIGLWTSFPYLQVGSLIKKIQTNKTLLNHKADAENLYPAFRYDRYSIELNRRTDIEVILNPQAKFVNIEVVEAEGAGSGLDTNTLKAKGLKIYKSNRARNIESKGNSYVQYLKGRNRAKFNLKQTLNQNKITEELDHKIFKITIEGVIPGLYVIKATVDGVGITTTKILTKEDFRIDDISPSIIDFGVETTLTIEGKGFDSLTQVFLGDNVEIKEIESLDEGVLKVKVIANEVSVPGFHDVTIASLLHNNSAVLVNGFYAGPRIGKDGEDGKDGEAGLQGLSGEDGKSICNNSEDTLKVNANNLPPGSQATSFFDPVLCNLTLGVPIGFNGINATGATGAQGNTGSAGATGAIGTTGASGFSSLIKVTNEPDGSNCDEGGIKVQTGLDSNQNNVLDSGEVLTTNYVCNGEDD